MTKKKIILLFFVVFSFFAVSLILNSNLFVIKQIVVNMKQLGCTDNDQIKNTSGFLGQNFFFLNNDKAINKIKEKFICVKDINVSRLFPSSVKMEVIFRDPAAILISLKNKEATSSLLLNNIATPSADQIKDLYVSDSEGITFSKDINGLNIPKVYLYDLNISMGKMENDLVQNSLKILDKIKTLGIKTKDSLIKDVFLIINPFIGEPKIIFSLNGKNDIQIASLQLILIEAKINEETLGFIDLRFDKPVVQFAPKKN